MSAGRKRKPSKQLSGRLAIFITILLFVCTLMFLNNKFSSGSMRRLAYLVFNGVRGDATESSITFDSNEYNRYALLKGNLCVVSPEEISVYKVSGKKNMTEPVLLRSPAIAPSKSRYVAYDIGGLNLYVANNNNILFKETYDSKILNVNINKSGDFAVVTDGVDCKSLVTMYNSSFSTIYKFHSSEKYIFDAAISPDGKEAAIITYGASDGTFATNLSLCKTSKDGFYATASLGDSVPLKVAYHSDKKILVICHDKTYMYNASGELISEISHNELPVKAFSQSYGKHTAILLDNYTNGGNSKVLVLDKNGNQLGELLFDEDIYSISCAGKYTSLQFSNRCVVYNDDLELHCEFQIPNSISRCIVNNDGTVLSIGENFATLYVE